jgi:parallel beta-helix repeat protein
MRTGARHAVPRRLRRALGLPAAVVATLAACAAPVAAAVTRVVAPTGRNAWPGTAAKPWRTLQYAADHAVPGMTVIARPGRYAPFVLRHAGGPGAPIVIRGAGAVIAGGRANAGATLFGVHDVVLRGFVITGLRGAFTYAVRVVGGARVTVAGNRVAANAGFGVYVDGSAGFAVSGNVIVGNGTGVEIANRTSGAVVGNGIANNTKMITNTPRCCDDRGANGVVLYRTTGPVRVTQNRIHGNRARSFDYGWDGGAFEIFEASGVTIDHNVVWDNENVLETGTGGRPCTGNSFFRNVAYGAVTRGRALGMILRCAAGMLVANNTFSGIQGFAFDVAGSGPYAGSIAGLRVVNNIAVTRAAHPYALETAGAYAMDHNVVWSAPAAAVAYVAGHGNAPNMAAFRQWTGHEVHGLFTRPLFTAPARHVYTLQPGSPARKRGIPVPGVTVGPTPDAGAY